MRLSIVTVNFNNALGLENTFRSIAVQTLRDFEFLVIDGNSSDQSIQVIHNWKSIIDQLVVETDEGIYEAMNKGVLRARGEYLFFLNSGDVLKSSNTIANIITELDGKDILYGDVVWRDGLITKYPSQLRFSFLKRRSLPHQATFIKKSLFAKVGLYDECLKITGDWKFFLLAVCKYNASYRKINKVISVQESGGISDSGRRNTGLLISSEKASVLSSDFGPFVSDYLELEGIDKWKRIVSFGFWRRFFSKYRKSTAVCEYDW